MEEQECKISMYKMDIHILLKIMITFPKVISMSRKSTTMSGWLYLIRLVPWN